MESGQQVGPQSDSLPLPHGQLLLDQPLPAQIQRLADLGAIAAPGRDRICAGQLPVEPGRPVMADQLRERSIGQYRSEEHTSELQSLMRISYAVFCLKKKK